MPKKLLDYAGLQNFLDKLKGIVPTKTSELQNDSGFITSEGAYDSELSSESEKAVQNKVVTAAINSKQDSLSSGQLDAANSGITVTKIQGYDSHLSDTDIHVTQTDKANWDSKAAGTHTHTASGVSGLSTVATSGSYADLSNKPSIPSKTSDLTNDSGFLTSHNPVDSALSTTSENAVQNKVVKAELDNKANSADLSTVATTGSYTDLNNIPSNFTPASHTHGSITNDGKLGTASRALITDGNKKIAVSSVTSTELGYLSGVTSAVQDQLDGKAASTHSHTASEVSGLATVATSGSYNDLTNKPTIPTVNNATLTIQKNGTTVKTFTANASSNVTANITVPTKVSELTNDSGFLTSHNPVDSALSDTSTNAVQNKIVKGALDGKSDTGHTHTKSEITDFPTLATVATSGSYNDLSNKPTIPTVNNATLTIQKNGTTVKTFTANASSNVTANITVPTAVSELTNDSGYLTSASSLDSSKLTGTIDIDRLPAGALERLVTVADQTARFALTTSDVQLGDTVKQLDTGVMYIVSDESKLSSNDGYTEYTAGSATSVPWSGVTGKPSSYTPASHSHGNIANGGTLGTASRALITDGNKKITTSSVTSTELGYVSGVTSAIQTQLNGKAPSSHTHAASEVSGLATVATSGSYNDLSNKPTIDSALSSTSTNAVQNKVINSALAGKAASSHTHTKSQITDFPTKTSQFTNDSHQTITVGTDTTSTASPAHSGTFTCIDSVTRDSNGHVTAVNTKTVTLPADNNTDTKVTQNVSASNASYPILCCPTAEASANQGAKTSIFGSGVKINPYYSQLCAGNYIADGMDGLRLRQAGSGKYSAIFRNDGAGTYILVTNENDPNGSWNDFRPLHINNATGICNITGNVSGSSGSCTGNAATATNATNNANGKELSDSIIKGLSVSGKTITYTQIDGTTGTITTQDTNTDTLMTQNVSTTNATYPILLCATADATANQGAKTGIFGSGVKVNPSTSTISATTFSGALSGNAATSSGLIASTGIVQNGITYTGGMYFIGTSAGQIYKGSSNNAALISAPENGTFWAETTANVQNLRFTWANDGKYLHDIFVSPNNNYIWHRDVVNGTARPWRRVVEENATGLTDQTWSINIGGNAATATQFSANKSVTLTGDVTGTASSKAGWSVATTLANSGVTAGTYGPSADVTGNNNATISVPQITVDAKGRVTSVVNKTLTCKNNTYTVNNATLTIQKNGTNVATFTSNASANATANITVPTKTSELTNDSGFLTSHQSLSNYVTLNGAQTISAQKIFTAMPAMKNNVYVKGATPSTNSYAFIEFFDKNAVQTGWIGRVAHTDGYDTVTISTSNKFTNGTKSTSGSDVYAELEVGLSPTGAKYLSTNAGWLCNLLPMTNRGADLGSTTYQWNMVYAGEFHAYNDNAFIAKSGGYTFLIRNDGGNTYFLMSEQNGNEGTWSNARPLTINNATGICDINGSCGGTAHGLQSSLIQYGDSVTYTEGQITIGTAAGNAYKGSSNNGALISFPENGTAHSTAANVQNLRLAWFGDWQYWHDIFVSPNNDYIWHRNVTGGTARGWRRVVEENVSGLTNQTWSINIGGSAASATNDGSGNVISTTYGKLASANTWSAVNTFSAGQLKLKSAYQEIGVKPANSTVQYFEFNDKNNAQHGAICLWNYNTGASEIQMYIADKFKNGAKDPTGTTESTVLSFGFKENGSKFLTFSGQLQNSLIPNANNTYDLGSSTYRWKSINGVNPGALFLPKISNKVSLTERLTDLTGQTSLHYLPPYNGWISIETDNTATSNFIRCSYDNILVKADGNALQSGMSILCPVLAGVEVIIYVKCVTLTSAFFYPSLGDVNSTT